MTCGHGQAVEKRQDGVLFGHANFLFGLVTSYMERISSSASVARSRQVCIDWIVGSTAFLSSYLRKRPDTYKTRRKYTRQVYNRFQTTWVLSQLEAKFATEMITQGACSHTQIPKAGWLVKEYFTNCLHR